MEDVGFKVEGLDGQDDFKYKDVFIKNQFHNIFQGTWGTEEEEEGQWSGWWSWGRRCSYKRDFDETIRTTGQC